LVAPVLQTDEQLAKLRADRIEHITPVLVDACVIAADRMHVEGDAPDPTTRDLSGMNLGHAGLGPVAAFYTGLSVTVTYRLHAEKTTFRRLIGSENARAEPKAAWDHSTHARHPNRHGAVRASRWRQGLQ